MKKEKIDFLKKLSLKKKAFRMVCKLHYLKKNIRKNVAVEIPFEMELLMRSRKRGFFSRWKEAYRILKLKHREKLLFPSSDEKNAINEENPLRKNSLIGQLGQCIEKNDYNPLVSIIVPNFNHESYLRKRLESIYNQSYRNIEILLLDDCSSDQSQKILLEYQSKYPDVTTCVFNERNSGNVFFQWKKGLNCAKGDLVWIAESDDFCDLNFLEELIPCFSNAAIQLAYARSIFIKDEKQIWSIEEYLSDIDAQKWKESFVNSAYEEVKYSFSIKNIIPNVSSAVFRRKNDLKILDDSHWLSFRLCGDWLLYLEVIRGGLIAYSTKTTNYYRIHDKNTSGDIRKTYLYLQEHEMIARKICSLYDVEKKSFVHMRRNMLEWYISNGNKWKEEEFLHLFSLKKILVAKKERIPHILMCDYGFIPGGGETFPIFLANALYKAGHTVTFLDFHLDVPNEEIKALLNPSIPIVTLHPLADLSEVVNSIGADICHSHQADVDHIIALNRHKFHRCKHVVTLHGMYESICEQKSDNFLSFLESNVDHFFYISDRNLSSFNRNKFDLYNFTKIGNGLEKKTLTPVIRSELGIEENDFVLCLVSRAILEKGWKEAVAAVEMAQKLTQTQIHLLLIGDGPAKDMVNTSNENIHVLGFKSNPSRYFAMADMGILPSYFQGESFPLVMIECILAGKPFLATDVGEIRNHLTTDSGDVAGAVVPLINERPDVITIAREIVSFIEDKEKYDKAVKYVGHLNDKFDIDNVAAQYAETYIRLCNE